MTETPVRDRPSAPLAGCAQHYGRRVAELGDDGDMYAVEGHVGRRRARAVVMAYLRRDCGLSLDGLDRSAFEAVAEATVEHRWVALTGDDNEPWEWSDHPTPGSHPITFVSAW